MDWHTRLTNDLSGASAAPSFGPDANAALEIAFGIVRAELTYVLELGRAHRAPITGNVAFDDVHVELGGARVSARIERKAAGGAITLTAPNQDGAARFVYDEGKHAV